METDTSNFLSFIPDFPRQKREDGDYYDLNGLLICGKCDTPRECRVELTGDRIFPCLCKCRREEQEKELRQTQARENRLARERIRELCFPCASMRKWSFAESNGKFPRLARGKGFVDSWEKLRRDGFSLIVTGQAGSGKTYFAAAIANALVDRGVRVRLLRSSDAVNRMLSRPGERQDFLAELQEQELLILDDVASHLPDAAQEVLGQLLKNRQEEGSPVIVTTRMTEGEISSKARKSSSRLFEALGAMTFFAL